MLNPPDTPPAPHAGGDDQRFMDLALQLARRGLGCVEPNPLVGAVLVRDGQILGQGWHERFGDHHAEVNAIQHATQLGHDTTNATLYLTLEPCAHTGKTPPCTHAITQAGITRVVAAMADPAPHAAGKGFEQLRSAGIDVQIGLGEQAAHQLNEPYLKRLRTGLPWVILKWAQTLDGRVAARSGHSQWISNPQSRHHVHQLRARVDAIIVGIGTLLADDPLLTARELTPRRTARRVVIDPTLRIPESARILTQPADAPVLIATDQNRLQQPDEKILRLEAAGIGLLGLPPRQTNTPAPQPDHTPRHELELEPLLRQLARNHHATNIMVEGGPRLLGSLLDQQLADQILAFLAPRLLADPQALPAAIGSARPQIDHAIALELRHVQQIEQDLLLDYRITPS